MSVEAIETRDVTDRAVSGGWQLPGGWTVRADITYDDAANAHAPDNEGDAFDDPAIIAAWKADRWTFVMVSVWVQDSSSREWGRDLLGACVHGDFPAFDPATNRASDTETNMVDGFDAVTDHDMIRNALLDAVEQLQDFGTPVIREPEGDAVTGL